MKRSGNVLREIAGDAAVVSVGMATAFFCDGRNDRALGFLIYAAAIAAGCAVVDWRRARPRSRA